MSVYIQSAEAISSQNTFESQKLIFELINSEADYLKCLLPDFKKYIEPASLRRMSKILKISLASAVKCLKNLSINEIDAIIVGTGLGCTGDTIKFLNQIIENNESLLNPTPFISSTHNSISGQIALTIKCKKYNFTFSQNELSFETALLEAIMLFKETNAKKILIGGTDEIDDELYYLIDESGCYKSLNIRASEGSTFFVLSNNNENNYCKIADLLMFFKKPSNEELSEKVQNFLNKNNLNFNDIDLIISGLNDNQLINTLYSNYKKASIVKYKHLIGEYQTTSAFALFLANNILSNNFIDNNILHSNITQANYQNALVFNYYKNNLSSIFLLTKA